MDWQSLSYLIPYLISMAISALVAIYTWRYRQEAGAKPYALVALAAAVWTLGYVLELTSPALEAKIYWDNVQWLAAVAWCLAFLAFSLEYTGRKLVNPRRTWGLLAVVPILFFFLVLTDALHGLVRPAAWLVAGEPFAALVYDFSAVSWVISIYGYGLVLAGIYYLVKAFLHPQRLYRGQVATILVGALIPMLGTILTLAGITPTFHRDISPFTFALGNLVVLWGLVHFRLFDIVPVARDAIVESMSDAVIVLDTQNRVVDLNPAAQVVVGWPASEVIGRPATEILTRWSHLVEQYREVAEASAEITVDTDEGPRQVDLKLSPLRDRRGALTGRLIVVRDITARKRAEAALRAAHDELERRVEERTAELAAANVNLKEEITGRKRTEETLQRRTDELEALRQMGLAITSQLDLDALLGTIVSRAVELLRGTTGALYLHRPDEEILEVVVAIGVELADIGSRLRLGQGLAGKVWQRGEPLIVGDYRHWPGRHTISDELQLRSTVGVPIRWGEAETGGELLGVLAVAADRPGSYSPSDAELLSLFATQAAIAIENAHLFQDLQDRMAELERTQAQLVQAAKMATIGQLAAGTAHEINNPMTGVLGFGELLLKSIAPDDPARESLQIIVQEAARVRDIVRNLLNFSRQSGSQRRWTAIDDVVRETLALVRPQLAKKGVHLVEGYAPDLPCLWADPNRLKQVVLNLVTNAMQATPPEGTLTVTCECLADEVALRVVDTGEGIPEAVVPRIFEPYFTTKPIGQGTGLGLSISQGIVQDHGGRIEVESRLGEGSTFTVWLPIPSESLDTTL
ncbi:MAG: histidine kinase N-terminal 7TM domain-containing protein [Anaerolineae bacterium]|jgi:PAS domain S-box-containing protein